MSCMEHLCRSCRNQFMDNQRVDICPYCKLEGTVTNWFDEESSNGDDYNEIEED